MIFSTAKWEPTPLERELRAGDDGAVHFYTQVARILRTGDLRPEFR